MTSTLNLSLTDDLKQFIYSNSGNGTMYSTPSEFVRDLIREKKQRIDASNLRRAVLQGYDDILNNRFVEFNGNIEETISTAQKQSWWTDDK